MASRLKARFARHEMDREMHTALAEAIRALGRAEGACARASRLPADPTTGSGMPHRAREYLRTIRRAGTLVQSIGNLVPNLDFTDPDLLTEDALAERARQRRAARSAVPAPTPNQPAQADQDEEE